MTNAELAAVFRRLADEVEKMDAPPAPVPEASVAPSQPPSQDPPPAPPPPAPPAAPTKPVPVINLDTILGIQQAFNSIRAPGYAKLEENGVHDAVMTWALKEFQATAGVPTTGKADPPTINALHKIIFGAPKT